MEKQKVRGKDYSSLNARSPNYGHPQRHVAHREALQRIKAESVKPNPDKAKIERLKQQMTRWAKIFLKAHKSVALEKRLEPAISSFHKFLFYKNFDSG